MCGELRDKRKKAPWFFWVHKDEGKYTEQLLSGHWLWRYLLFMVLWGFKHNNFVFFPVARRLLVVDDLTCFRILSKLQDWLFWLACTWMCKEGREARAAADPKGWERSCPAKSTVHGTQGIWWPYNMLLPLLRTATWGKIRGKSSISLSAATVEIAFLRSAAVKVRYGKQLDNVDYDRWVMKCFFKTTLLQKLLLMA